MELRGLPCWLERFVPLPFGVAKFGATVADFAHRAGVKLDIVNWGLPLLGKGFAVFGFDSRDRGVKVVHGYVDITGDGGYVVGFWQNSF